MTVQSAVLKSFYVNIQTWIDADYPSHPIFKKSRSLCHALTEFLYELGANRHMRDTIRFEMLNQFSDAGLTRGFPFSSIDKYVNEVEQTTLYENDRRLAWIIQHAQEEPHV